MSKRKKLTALEQQIQSLTSNIKTIDELEDLTRQLRKATLEAMLEGEMDDHLGYARHATDGHHSGNSRNGYSGKTLKGEHGQCVAVLVIELIPPWLNSTPLSDSYYASAVLVASLTHRLSSDLTGRVCNCCTFFASLRKLLQVASPFRGLALLRSLFA